MIGPNLTKIIEQVGKEKGIDKKVIIEALESAMITAAKKKYGIEHDIEAQFNEEMGEVELFEFKTVTEEVKNPSTEISVEEGRKLDAGAQVGDSLGVKMDAEGLGRIAAQTAKQVIIQKVIDAEREIIYKEFADRKSEVMSGIVRRVEKGGAIIDLGRTEGYMPMKEMIPTEHLRPGDRVQCILKEVLKDTPGFQLILSRTSSELLKKLFEIEVPEISDHIVEIKSAAREPGARAKISVYSKDSDVDPVGACVGMKGSRVQNVVRELRGEEIDIAVKRLTAVNGVSETIALTCFHHGITKPEDLVRVPAEDISKITGFEVARAQELLASLKLHLDRQAQALTEEKKVVKVEKTEKPEDTKNTEKV